MCSVCMVFPRTLSQIEDLNSSPVYGMHFARNWAFLVVPPQDPPQSSRQTERMNQSVAFALRCVAVKKIFLLLVEYAVNSLVCYATGLSQFEVSLGY